MGVSLSTRSKETVLSGEGELSYEEQTYQLGEGDCVFIDCRKAYSHSTSDDLWSLQWCHFYAPSLPAVYEKYKERGGHPVFHPADIEPFTTLLTDIYDLASSSDYIRDMRINEKLGTLLTLLMEQKAMVKPVIIETQRFEDFRGWLSVPVDKSIDFRVVQINQGFSRKAGTLRGLHFQEGEHAQARASLFCLAKRSTRTWLLCTAR